MIIHFEIHYLCGVLGNIYIHTSNAVLHTLFGSLCKSSNVFSTLPHVSLNVKEVTCYAPLKNWKI